MQFTPKGTMDIEPGHCRPRRFKAMALFALHGQGRGRGL